MVDGWQREGEAKRRIGFGADGSDDPGLFVERGIVREERGRVAVGPKAQ